MSPSRSSKHPDDQSKNILAAWQRAPECTISPQNPFHPLNQARSDDLAQRRHEGLCSGDGHCIFAAQVPVQAIL